MFVPHLQGVFPDQLEQLVQCPLPFLHALVVIGQLLEELGHPLRLIQAALCVTKVNELRSRHFGLRENECGDLLAGRRLRTVCELARVLQADIFPAVFYGRVVEVIMADAGAGGEEGCVEEGRLVVESHSTAVHQV